MLFCIAVAIVLVAAALQGWGVLDVAPDATPDDGSSMFECCTAHSVNAMNRVYPGRAVAARRGLRLPVETAGARASSIVRC